MPSPMSPMNCAGGELLMTQQTRVCCHRLVKLVLTGSGLEQVPMLAKLLLFSRCQGRWSVPFESASFALFSARDFNQVHFIRRDDEMTVDRCHHDPGLWRCSLRWARILQAISFNVSAKERPTHVSAASTRCPSNSGIHRRSEQHRSRSNRCMCRSVRGGGARSDELHARRMLCAIKRRTDACAS